MAVNIPICKCGCGNETSGGDYLRGHWLRANKSFAKSIGKLGVESLTVEQRMRGTNNSAKIRCGKTFDELYGTERSNELRAIISNTHKDKIVSESTKEKLRSYTGISSSMWGKHHSEETKRKMSDSKLGDNNPSKRETVKTKLRKIRTEQLQNAGSTANYNPLACELFDKINQVMNLDGVHALNGGEYVVNGYWLDYYDSKHNLVIEYDEPFHYNNGILRNRDIYRENVIKDTLNCKFIRIKHNDSWDTIKKLIQGIL